MRKMRTMKKIAPIFALILLMWPQIGHTTEPALGFAEQPHPQPHPMLKKIDYLIMHDEHLTSTPWTGHFTALNGKQYQLSQFYKNRRNLAINLKAGIEIFRNANLKISLPVHFDNGYKADLYEAERFLGFGVSVYYAPRKNLFLSFNMVDIVQFGGQTKERPCYDDFRREFHCGTGYAWTDMKHNLDQHHVQTNIQARVLYLF